MSGNAVLARALRKAPTWAERTLWRRFRNRGFAQFKFRRQYPVGPYVVDFYCASKRVAVELDGDVHDIAEQRKHDLARDAFLAEQGIRVLRFWNVEVLENPTGVLDRVYAELCRGTTGPHPGPLPQRERESQEEPLGC